MAEKILIVDDDEDLRSELRDFLEGYDVVEAGTGREALKILSRAHEIALMILDVMMPGMNGLEVLKEIKTREPGLAIIILTGFSSKEVAVKALKSHADDFIEKPIDIDKIKEAIEGFMEKRFGAGDINAMGIKGKIEKIQRFIQRNCYKKTGLEEAAGAVAWSPKYLSRIFKQETGMGFAEYRMQIKLEKAKELLTGSAYNVSQVAEKLGYETPESFIRQFKKYTRLTPARFRKKTKSVGARHGRAGKATC